MFYAGLAGLLVVVILCYLFYNMGYNTCKEKYEAIIENARNEIESLRIAQNNEIG